MAWGVYIPVESLPHRAPLLGPVGCGLAGSNPEISRGRCGVARPFLCGKRRGFDSTLQCHLSGWRELVTVGSWFRPPRDTTASMAVGDRWRCEPWHDGSRWRSSNRVSCHVDSGLTNLVGPSISSLPTERFQIQARTRVTENCRISLSRQES